MIYLTSDSHFQHENIIKYCHRPFSCADEMDKIEIERWNSVVSPDDEVYHLGDFIMGKASNIQNILPQLNGKIHLIRGNHDTTTKINVYKQFSNKIVEITDIKYLEYKELWFILCHFPITSPDFIALTIQGNSEVVDVHGHVHDISPFYMPDENRFNVSVDVTNFTPVSIDVLYQLIRQKYIDLGIWKGE